jgi:hypothetical protein
VQVGVLSYLQYGAELENRDGHNAFDVTRGYINIRGNLSPKISYRMTPDVKRVTDSSLAGTTVVRLKYLYLQVQAPATGSRLKLGIHQTPWIDFEQSINRYRVQGTMFSERIGVVPASGDFGLGYLTPLPGGLGEVEAGVYNGEGYSKADPSKHKSLQGRLSVDAFRRTPLGDRVRLHGFYDLGWYDTDRPRRHGIVMASYEDDHVVATGQWLAGTERARAAATRNSELRGYSAFLEIREDATGWAGLARFDDFDPDTAAAGDDHQRIIAGAAYWARPSPGATLGLVFTIETVRYGNAAAAADERRFLAQTQVQF